MKRKLGAAAFCAMSFWVGCVERKTSNAKDYVEAQNLGMLDAGGWLPFFLPRSARDIVEVHFVDSSSVCVKFEMSIEDVDPLRRQCGNSAEVVSTKLTCRASEQFFEQTDGRVTSLQCGRWEVELVSTKATQLRVYAATSQ